MIGTMLHEDCLLMRMAEDPAYETVNLSICNEQYVSNWPEFMTDDDVKQLVDRFKMHNKLDVFYREYMNLPAATEDASFQASYFQPYQEHSEEFISEAGEIENVVIGDPAKTAKMQSADSAIVGIGINLKRRKLYVRDIVKGKMRPKEFMENMLAMGNRFRLGNGFCRIMAIEVVSLSEWITQPFKTMMRTNRYMYKLVELKGEGATGKIEAKDARIGAMSGYYESGWVYHNPTCCAPLEQQLLSFPRAKLRDIMDALAYVLYLMECGKLMFEPELNQMDDIERQHNEEFDESMLYEEEDMQQLAEIGNINWRLVQ